MGAGLIPSRSRHPTNLVKFVRSQSVGGRIALQALLALLCLTLAVEGAHVCPTAQPDAPGVQAEAGAQAPFCTVCAIAHSLLVAVVLLLVLFIPTRSHAEIVPVQAQAFWDGLRLYVRPPPVLL